MYRKIYSWDRYNGRLGNVKSIPKPPTKHWEISLEPDDKGDFEWVGLGWD